MINILIHAMLLFMVVFTYTTYAGKLNTLKNDIEKEAYKKNMALHRDVRELAARVQEAEQLIKEHRKDESIHVKQYDACDCDDDDGEEYEEFDEAKVYPVGSVVVHDNKKYMFINKTGMKVLIPDNTKV